MPDRQDVAFSLLVPTCGDRPYIEVMATTTSRGYGGSTYGSGWLAFAGTLGIMVGLLNAIAGLIAIFRGDYYAISDTGRLIVLNLTGWGWFLLILGALQIIVGIGVLGGQAWARIIGIILAVGSVFANVFFIVAAPFWSILVIGLAAVVIYALIVPPRGAKA